MFLHKLWVSPRLAWIVLNSGRCRLLFLMIYLFKLDYNFLFFWVRLWLCLFGFFDSLISKIIVLNLENEFFLNWVYLSWISNRNFWLNVICFFVRWSLTFFYNWFSYRSSLLFSLLSFLYTLFSSQFFFSYWRQRRLKFFFSNFLC